MNLDVTKSKFFQFNITIDGIDHKTLDGKLEFIYENISYGFPVKILKNKVEIEIPPLQSIIKKHISENDSIICSLNIDGDELHIQPWKNELDIIRNESDNLIITNANLTKNKKSKYDKIMKEDQEFLEKLNQNNDMDVTDISIFEKEKLETICLESDCVTPIKKINKTIQFDKKIFLKQAMIEENNAVENGFSFEESSKNDNKEQKELRLKIRNIIQEGYIKKLKTKTNTSTVQQLTEVIKVKNIQEVEKIEEIDFSNLKDDAINKKVIVMMMESVGMTTEKTQNKMIEHAKDKGAKSEIEIYDTIKGMIFPNQSAAPGMTEQHMEFMSRK